MDTPDTVPFPFPFPPDGGSPILERFGYLTDIITAHSGREQRIRLRTHPAGGQEFEVLEEAADAQLLNSIIYRHQAEPWAAPLWQYRSKTTADVSAGATMVPVETDLEFLDEDLGHGVYALLWASPTIYELLLVDRGNLGNQLLLNAPLASDWPTGTIALPVRLSRLTPSTKLSWFGQTMLGGRLSFEYDLTGPGLVGLNDPDPANDPDYASSIYGRLESEPGRLIALEDDYRRAFTVLGSGFGARQTVSLESAPALARPFLWQADNPIFMKAWLAQRRGRAVPFWFWTYEQEFTLASPVASGAGTITIVHMRYSPTGNHAGLFSNTGARRWLRFRFPDGTGFDCQVNECSDNLDGTETLSIFPVAPRDIPVSTLCGFRRFCRLDEDVATIEHHGPEWAETTLRVLELPLEAPLPVS